MTERDENGSFATIETRNLGKTYGSFVAVEGLDLRVAAGEVYGLLGPNGAGKTTTLKMLLGVLKPTTGTARVFGLKCFEERAEVVRKVGYLPDEPTFHDHLTGEEILRFVGDLHGLDRDAVEDRIATYSERFEVRDALTDFAVDFSKGMKKKLALIAALLHDPDVLILDEPTNGLDPYATRELLSLVRDLAARKKTVLFSTHLLDQAERVCDKAAILDDARLVGVGPLEALRVRFCGRDDASLEEVFFAATGGAGDSAEVEETPPSDPPA
jgi:ABC-2 type transport system ATP-binding protein